jgi:glycine oxidase
MKKNFDVAILGNGILAMTTAYQLRKRNKNIKVVIIGKKSRIGSASLAAGAMINLWAEIVEGQFEDPALSERFDLTSQGTDLWPSFAEELSEYSESPLCVKKGTYLIQNARGTSIEDRAIKYIKTSLLMKGIEHFSVDPSTVPWLMPSSNSRVFDITWLPDGRIDSRLVIQALDRAIERLGIEYIDDNAIDLKISQTSVILGKEKKEKHYIKTENETSIEADQIVFAAGAFSQKLIDKVNELKNATPRILFGGGCGLNLEFPPWVHKYGGINRDVFDMDVVIRTPDRGGACGIHVVPYGDGRYYVGASSGVWMEPDLLPKIHGVHTLVHGVLHEISHAFFYAGIELRGNGFRPVTMDCYPLIGESHVKGVWFLNGTKRDGFTMAPFLSTEVAKGILGEGKPNFPERFKPSRKLISYKERTQAIEAAELMYEGSDFQHGGQVVLYMTGAYRAMRRKSIEEIYKKREIENFGIHPELLHIYENDDFYSVAKHEREIK